MALTLMIEGRPLRSRDYREMNGYAGRIEPGAVQHSADNIEALRATAAELRDLALRSGAERPKRRLIYRDALDQMEAKGYLRAEQATAGREIALGYQIKMTSGGARVGGYCEMVALPCGELIPASVGSLMMERYLPWQVWARATFANAARTVTYEQATNLVCVEGLGQQQAADVLKMDRRTVLGMLRTSLWQYCVMAGMVDDGPQEAA